MNCPITAENLDTSEISETNTTWESLNFSTRAKTVLARLNITNVEALKNLSKDTLTETKGAGAKTINEILQIQENLGS